MSPDSTSRYDSTSRLYEPRVVAAHVCSMLHKGDIRIGLGLVARYEAVILEALALYGHEAEEPSYLARLVVDDFKSDANNTFGNLPQIAKIPAGYVEEHHDGEVLPMTRQRLDDLIYDSTQGPWGFFADFEATAETVAA